MRLHQDRSKPAAPTCPQYLFLTFDDLKTEGFTGAKCICSPPPRDAANREHVWNAVADGTFDVFSSDHAPFRYDDPEGKKLKGTDAGLHHVPNGIPGLEARMPLLFSEGVMAGRISLPRFVALRATNAARIHGLVGRKGSVAVGCDADLVIRDPEAEWTIRNEALHHAVDYTPYEGRRPRCRRPVSLDCRRERPLPILRPGARGTEPSSAGR